MDISLGLKSFGALMAFPVRGEKWAEKMLIGSGLILLSFIVPIVPLIFVYGYAIRVMLQAIGSENLELPAWRDWDKLASFGARALVIGLIFLLPAIVVFSARQAPQDLMPWVYATLAGILTFFITITAFVANPFRTFAAMEIPANGQGLNPLLQNPWMVVHPPTLYFGYVGAAIPLAFAVAALLAGRLDNAWVRATRRWALFTFGFLTVGIWLGAYWAYLELGWGGFWAWDPVEHASFLPWLTLTAYLHSVIIQ